MKHQGSDHIQRMESWSICKMKIDVHINYISLEPEITYSMTVNKSMRMLRT
jgi:hypothetical protein